MDSAFLITAFATLFVIVDPIGLMPLFLAMTQGMTQRQRRAIGLRACIVAAVLLTVFAAFGEAVLGFVGITMPAFRIAGGILLFLTALDMLFERRSKRREDQAGDQTEATDHPDPSVFPLAIPLIAGPGAIASMILLTGERPGLRGGGDAGGAGGGLHALPDGGAAGAVAGQDRHRGGHPPARHAAGGAFGAIRARRAARLWAGELVTRSRSAYISR
jgi:MarC family membrane protein